MDSSSVLGIVTAVALLFAAGPAKADGEAGQSARKQASSLHDAAERALKAGDWETACRLYEESQSLDPSATTQARIAQCMEHQGKLASALRAYESALSLADELDPLRKKKANAAFPRSSAALEPRVPKLRITVRAPVDGLRVEIDGRSLGASTLESPIPLDPGRHTVGARAPKSPPVKCDF